MERAASQWVGSSGRENEALYDEFVADDALGSSWVKKLADLRKAVRGLDAAASVGWKNRGEPELCRALVSSGARGI